MNPKYWLPKFDPSAVFIIANWRPGFTHGGTVPARDSVLDTTGIRPDTLRALYENRWIRMAEPGELPDPVVDARVQALVEGKRPRGRPRKETAHGATVPSGGAV